MSTKSIVCKNCNNDLWETFITIANCVNCGLERPFHSRQQQTDKMSPAQEKAIEIVRKVVLEHDGLHSSNYEYKRFEVELLNWGSVQVLTEVGSKTNEGTMAHFVCRERRQIFIGRKGGLTLCNPARFIKDDEGYTKKVSKRGWIKGPRALTHPSI